MFWIYDRYGRRRTGCENPGREEKGDGGQVFYDVSLVYCDIRRTDLCGQHSDYASRCPVSGSRRCDGAGMYDLRRDYECLQCGFYAAVFLPEFFVVAEKSNLGFGITMAAGITNIVLDALFIAVFHWGVAGAAIASVIGQCVGGVLPLLYFGRRREDAEVGGHKADRDLPENTGKNGEADRELSRGGRRQVSSCLKNTSLLQLTKVKMEPGVLVRTCANGSSELMSNISSSVVGMLYNFQLMKYAGENGIAAYGVVMYTQMIFFAIYIGYAVGTSPIVSYHYGAGNHGEMRSLLRKSLLLMAGTGIVMMLSAQASASVLSGIFVGYDEELLEITIHAFLIFACSYLLSGVNIYASSFFTALNNGGISAAISFLRALVFQTGAVILLPLLFGIDGIWWAVTVSE